MNIKVLSAILSLCIFCSLAAQAKYDFILETDKADGIYKKGETVKFSVTLLKNEEVAENEKFTCQFSVNGFWKEKKEYVSNGGPIEITHTFNGNDLWCTLKAEVPNKKVSKELGAIASPYEIKTAVAEPKDFDAFWKKQREELNKVPVKALEKVETPLRPQYAKYKDTVICYDVKVACSGDKPVSGYLCMPRNAKAKSLPALVTFQGSGVLSAWQQPEWGEKAITFNINAHGIENGKPYSFYRGLKLGSGKLDNYAWYGYNRVDNYYYKGVFIRIMRALDYVKSLPEWDGKNLIVFGASQGGTQSIVAAALDSQVTYCYAGVPALCDHGAAYADRTPGWPRVAMAEKAKLTTEKKWFIIVMNYYDVAHFAKRIKCETSISAGLLDYTCTPTSVLAAYNNIPAGVKKSIQIRPDGTHGSASEGMDLRFTEVLDAIVQSNK